MRLANRSFSESFYKSFFRELNMILRPWAETAIPTWIF
jgi:hypothetical protein